MMGLQFFCKDSISSLRTGLVTSCFCALQGTEYKAILLLFGVFENSIIRNQIYRSFIHNNYA